MKKLFYLLAVFLIALSWKDWGESGYDPVFRVMRCEDERTCLHEIGHCLDYEKKWVSQTDDFRIALANYAIMNWYLPVENRSEIASKILFFPGIVGPRYPIGKKGAVHLGGGIYFGRWGGTIELYAEMFVWTDGKKDNMPEIFHKYYNWDLAQELTAKHVGE